MAKVIDGIKEPGKNGVPPHLVILPETYKDEVPLPAVYLLHGLFGSRFNWTELTRITKYADEANIAIIAPEGNDSWYVGESERSLINELIPYIEANYTVRPERNSRAIAGISMGGYGALKIAFRHPEMFTFAGSLSGAFDAPRQTEKAPGTDWEIMRDSVSAAFGPDASGCRNDNDLFDLIKGPISPMPAVYFECGLSDQFLEVNRELERAFRDHGLTAEYKEVPGGHDWEYWDERLPNLLHKASSRFRGQI